ncbi:MAG: glutathione S-transferase family protein [Gammaproteobacteria bacterium]|nr:glutathione S-transferase family protein [Gammaproteobacteria bacterium]MDE2460905.1 glutathione S-transferase family protein [Gammaproteobacteria bacterium]
MKLYYSPLSSNSRKVRVVAALLDIPLELQNVELPKGAQRQPEFLAVNPMGKVPVLVDGDLVLPESAAIMIYLAESKPGNTLYPTECHARAEVNRWLFWAANHWFPAVGALALEKVLKPRFFHGEPDPAQIKRQEDSIQGFAKVLDEHLAKRQWVAGNSLTLADIAIAAAFASLVQLPIESWPHIASWFGRIRSLPAWQIAVPPSMP